MNNNMEKNYKPGQIIYVKSSLGSWSYISVLRCATPAKHADEAYELHTCCDLCIDPNSSDDLTFERGNGSFLDLDICFKEVREATNEEKIQLFDALVKAFKDYDLGWRDHFTDSSYYDIQDWLCLEFNIDFDDETKQNELPCKTIMEIHNYIWDSLCRETGNYHACTDYVEPETVNKQEFIEKLEKWIRGNTDWLDEYDWEGRNPNYGLWDELKKYLEE